MKKHDLLMAPLFGSECRCEEFFTLFKSRSRTRLAVKQVEGSTRMQEEKLNLIFKGIQAKRVKQKVQ
jgi:hypothetical protein